MTFRVLRSFSFALLLAMAGGAFGPAPMPAAMAGTAPTPLAISQVPLTVAMPAHPQVLFAIGNSQSMDGDESGAIMTGSGALTGGAASLSSSSSPVAYTVPAGFTAPVSGSTSGTAPYTVTTDGVQYDNSASRLNVAKAAIRAIVAAYAKNTQFALEDYSTGGATLYSTWVYQMSGPDGFTFSNDNTSPPAGFEYEPNPCYQYTDASSTVASNCTAIANLYPSNALASNPYMLVQNSSDDADVNDVLYWTGSTAVFADYGKTSKPNPYPPNFTLGNYNNGGVTISYASVAPSSGIKETGPTNAGFVPYSDQVFYARRGFGYDSTASATTGNIVVKMQDAGTDPTAASVQAVIDAFKPALAPETNSPSSPEIKAVAVQSPIAGLMQEAKTYLAGVPDPESCSKQYVILISDGLPTEDLNGKSWPPLGSAAAAGYGVTATNDQALQDTLNAIAALKSVGIDTYVVGMGAGVDPSLNLNSDAVATLNAMAVAGGTEKYFPATSPAALVTDLNSILISIQNGSLSSTSVAVNSGHLSSDSAVYQAVFTVSDTPYQDWTGDVDSYAIKSDGSIATSWTWSAKQNITSEFAGTKLSNRIIATWNPVGGTAHTGAGVPFEWTDLSATQQGDLAVVGDPTSTPTYAQLRLNYLRGDTSEEQQNKNGPFRNRSFLLGDIVDSSPVYVGEPQGPYLDASYRTFEQSFATSTTARTPMIYVGANDGMLHAINANTGDEVFAFVPNAVFANLADLTSPFYNANHHFFVDGSPQAGDVLFADSGTSIATWHTLLVGGEGAGGNSIYALDVTHPDSLTTESALSAAVLWEFTDADMGLSFSAPIIARINGNPVMVDSSDTQAAGFAVMFGNGYNSKSEDPIFYALDPGTGAVLAKIDLCTAMKTETGTDPCNHSQPNGLSSVVAANSSGVLGFPVDEVYAGDLEGDLWAIDVSDANPADWKVRLLFQARDASNNPQPITTAPVVTLNPNYPAKLGLMVFFGTGQLLQNSDLSTTSTQSFYGVWDNGSTTPATRNDLVQQTISTISAGTAGTPQDIRTSTNTAVDWSKQRGWYEDLPASGERVISPAVIENGGVVFDTYTPISQSGPVCAAGGQSWLMDVSYRNGGPFANADLDVAGNGDLNSTAQIYKGQVPVGMALGNSYVPTPFIMQAALGGGVGAVKVVSKPAANGTPGVGTIKERGHGPSRTGWWQIE